MTIVAVLAAACGTSRLGRTAAEQRRVRTMSSRVGLSGVLAICSVATIALADSKTYVPPPAEGDVYTVVRFKMGGFGTTQDTSVIG